MCQLLYRLLLGLLLARHTTETATTATAACTDGFCAAAFSFASQPLRYTKGPVPFAGTELCRINVAICRCMGTMHCFMLDNKHVCA